MRATTERQTLTDGLRACRSHRAPCQRLDAPRLWSDRIRATCWDKQALFFNSPCAPRAATSHSHPASLPPAEWPSIRARLSGGVHAGYSVTWGDAVRRPATLRRLDNVIIFDWMPVMDVLMVSGPSGKL